MTKHGDHKHNDWHSHHKASKQYVEPAKVTRVKARMLAAQPVVPVCIRKYLKRFAWALLGWVYVSFFASLAFLLGGLK